jgi:hypothetical protein
LVTWESVSFRIESTLMRAWYAKTGRRPTSGPFLSGDGFRALAHHEYDPAKPDLGLAGYRVGERIFCRGDWLRTFLTGPAQALAGPFSVISHNDDTTLTKDWLPLFPVGLQRLYAQNSLIVDERVVPLPIGLENASKHYNGVVADFRRLRRLAAPDLNRILFAFTESTNPIVRGPARAALEHNPLSVSLARCNSRTYRKIARRYRFVASPPGNGVDCHRTWEALYLRSVPIVLRSSLTEAFERLGLPLWLVDSYDELNGLTEGHLDDRYRRAAPGFENPSLWEAFWKDLVQGGGRL